MRKARGVSHRRKKRISGLNELTKEQTSAIGDIIDMPIEDFKQSLIDQQVNVGIMMNLTHLLSAVYAAPRSSHKSPYRICSLPI